ncbi:MAG: hypothetical protein H7325_00610, partial [Pedobacter sp.]|nr:hypothetical protein [Pedobacter sp.]
MAKLITTIIEVREHLPVNFTADFDRLKPYLDNAERLYILKVIGKTEFEELATIYQTAANTVSAIVDDKVRAAVFAAQKIITNIGFLMAVPTLSLSIGAAGIQIHSNTEKKQAFQWQVEDFKSSLQEIGFGGIEELLEILTSNPIIFSSYINSNEYLANTKYLITTAEEFNKHFEIKSSRFLFQTLGSLMARIEVHVLERIFGEVFMASVKAANATVPLKKLSAKFLKPALALLTGARAINEQIISFNQGVASFNFIS